MRLCHALVQDRSAVTAEMDFQAVAQQAVPLEGHQRILLPANTDIHTAAVSALFFWKLIHHGLSLRFSFCKHTILETQTDSH